MAAANEANNVGTSDQMRGSHPDLRYDPVMAVIVLNERDLARLIPSQDDFDLFEVKDVQGVLQVLPNESARRDFLATYIALVVR